LFYIDHTNSSSIDIFSRGNAPSISSSFNRQHHIVNMCFSDASLQYHDANPQKIGRLKQIVVS
jgi:hypothetical protein